MAVIVDVNDVPTHDAFFMFRDGDYIFLVHEANYDKFVESIQNKDNSVRDRLADVVIQKGNGVSYESRTKILKSRHF